MTRSTTGSDLIDVKLANLSDWRSVQLSRMRELILEAVPGITESVKWIKPSNPSGVPIWERAGMICTGEVYKTYVKLTFAQGAALDDPAKLLNAGFGGGTRRAIDLREGEVIDVAAFVALVRAAAEHNEGKQVSKLDRGVANPDQG